MHILIVEDDLHVAETIKESIVKWGHNVQTSATGKDALAKLERKKFDLMLLDIFLPDCKGYELIPRFKKLWPEIAIVTITGFNTRELELQVRQQGIHYYMTKPFDIKVLKYILDHIAKKKIKEVRGK